MDVNSTFEKTGIKCKVLQEIIQLAKKNCVEKVILFGSRARGDFKERSDIDLAFCGGSSSHFILDVDETTSTLLEFDMTEHFRAIAPAGTQPNLNTAIMKAYKQVIPPIELQKEFIRFVHQVNKSKFDTMTFAPIYAIINLYLHTYFYQGRR